MADKDLRIAKYSTLGVSFILMALGGGVWPFIWWEMYSSGNFSPPAQVERIELHVQDSDNQQHILRPMDLYTVDDDSSRQAAGHQLVYHAITGTDEQKAIYQPYLIQQIEFVLDAEIQQIEAWQHIWNVDFAQHPPIDIEQPAAAVLLETLKADSMSSVLPR